MITIHLTLEDLSDIRFAYSPMVELVFSYRTLRHPKLQARYVKWADETRHALHDVALPYLDTLTTTASYIPDFLTPTPTTTQVCIEDEIERLLATPDDLIRQNVQSLMEEAGINEMRQSFMMHPRDSLDCLAEELQLYWTRALAQHWPQITSILEGDILYRARTLAVEGADVVFADLNSMVVYQPRQIQIVKPHTEQDLRLNGDGLNLVPTLFDQSLSWKISPEWHPMLIYGVRGAGLWRQEASEKNPSLELALGIGRARVLQALKTPLNTGELAHKLDITAGAVSQQLDRLQQAGLVEPHRSGRRVFYQLTHRGQQLLHVFD